MAEQEAPILLPGMVSAHALEVHGSNTIGATLAPMLMTQFLQQLSGQPVTSAGTGTANETVLSTQRDGQPLTVLVAAHGSSTGYSALAAGQADVWAASRRVKSSEAQAMASRADLLSGDSEHIIAIDGLAILVHPMR